MELIPPLEIMQSFDPVTLAEMDAVRLLNRMDTKFVFSESKLPAVLLALKGGYRVLEASGTRSTRYENLYFDSADHRFYLQHHNGIQNRVKVRCRRYVESGMSWFEIKKKNNKSRTVKERIRTKAICGEINGKAGELLLHETGLDPLGLSPSLMVFYSRITLVNNDMTERLTIDYGIHFRNEAGERSCRGLVIAELKQNRSARSLCRSVMRQHHIHPFRISKYCLGMASLHPRIKQNNFKEKLIHINKISDGFN